MLLTEEPKRCLDLIEDEGQLRLLWQLDQSEYEQNNLPFESFKAWWTNYDLGLRVVKDQAEIIGAVGIWGLDRFFCRSFISGAIAEGDLIPVAAEVLEEKPTPYWYFSGIINKHPRSLGSPLRMLLHGGVGSWIAGGHIAFPANLYALGYSDDGKQLLERFGFEVIKEAWEMPDNCPLYWQQFASRDELTRVLLRK